jgi:hypothetical protein
VAVSVHLDSCCIDAGLCEGAVGWIQHVCAKLALFN